MKSYLQALGLSTHLSSPASLLFFDTTRYLFNCGDGLQRASGEHKIRLSKLRNIFITSLNLKTIASLPGMMLTLMDINAEKRRTIHGPPGISAFIESACTFMWNNHFDIIEYTNTDLCKFPYQLTTNHSFQDENVKIRVIPFYASEVDFIQIYKSKGTSLPIIKGSSCVYIIEGKPFPNKFLPAKAKALGVSAGPLFGKLANGETIEVQGKVITPEQVTEPGPPQPIIVIFDLNDPEHCESLNSALAGYLSPNFNLSLFVHFSPQHVVLSPEYIEMMHRFPNTSNLIFDPILTHTNPIFKKSHELILQLNKVLPIAFQVPFNLQENSLEDFQETFKNSVPNLVIPNFYTKFYFAQTNKDLLIDRGEEVKASETESILEHIPEPVPFVKSKSCTYSSLVDLSVAGSDPELLFLGTASMKPGTYRNVSSIYLSKWGGGLLMDCGEGSYGQLVRAYGEKINEVLVDLKGILITHLHADHHLGIIKVLAERAKLTDLPVVVVAPDLYRIYLATCEKIMGPLNYTFQNVRNIEIPDLEIKSVAVDHRIEAYAFVINHFSGWRIVYSGDTRPSPALIQEGFKATVLIHEATLDDSLLENAIQKYHSTLGEAFQVAGAMEAWKVVLTHFSQRYAKIPENTKVDAIYAFDLMRFQLSHCTEMVENMPNLLQLWKEDEIDP